MKKIYFIIVALVFYSSGHAAVRDSNTVKRQQTSTITTRSATNNTVNRTITKKITARTAQSPSRATISRNATVTPVQQRKSVARTAIDKIRTTANRVARASILQSPTNSKSFDAAYNTCHDAYFTCMDQFCATANDNYRRCICSSKLPEIQSREHALGAASDQLQDFKNLNLEIVNKDKSEVHAMFTETTGEQAQSKYQSDSVLPTQYSGISTILSNIKKQSLSTQGTVDIAGDINAIWSTTTLTEGKNIANLTGESLYNAVHAQCSELVSDQCPSASILKMVTSAYGMYIENDCSIVINSLNKRKNSTDSSIRASEHALHMARLENYNNHNSTSINDCVAQVRQDITADTACGPDYVHCLDLTGLYLNKTTGEPIYSANFYQLGTLLSLSGDVLTNSTNRIFVSELNNMRKYAQRGLDTCRDISDDVWDEFMRQAISEIYQGQQERIRQVKKECINVVNNCYDEQTKKLKDFSNTKSYMLVGQRLELSEQLCQEYLTTCSNVYGGGTDGMSELLIAMHNITDQKISNMCLDALTEYASNLCAVPGNDSVHKYPYACRAYPMGAKKYASNPICNSMNSKTTVEYNLATSTEDTNNYVCNDTARKQYTKCKEHYFLYKNKCYICPEDEVCPEGTTAKDLKATQCGTSYIGSIYHKIANYAAQVCVRPSIDSDTMPDIVMQDINIVVTQISKAMAQELSNECERHGGTWVNTIWQDDEPNTLHDNTGDWLHKNFYATTGANTEWGYCGTKNKNLAITNETQTSTEIFPTAKGTETGGEGTGTGTGGEGTGTGTGGNDTTKDLIPQE